MLLNEKENGIFDAKPDDKIENNQFLYIWIDILGFRDGLEKNDNSIYEELFEIRKRFINMFSDNDLHLKEVISISDGLVLVWDLNNLSIDELKNIFYKMAKLQIEFILKYKKVIRGAVSVGSISMNLYYKYKNEEKDKLKDVFLISNGLLKAYQIESKDIKWPIIATTYEILKEIRECLKIDNEEEVFGLTKINGNNHVYLYMIDFLEHLDENKRGKYEQLLLKNLEIYSKNGRDKSIFEKYYWLLKLYQKIYQNFLLKKLDEFYVGALI